MHYHFCLQHLPLLCTCARVIQAKLDGAQAAALTCVAAEDWEGVQVLGPIPLASGLSLDKMYVWEAGGGRGGP